MNPNVALALAIVGSVLSIFSVAYTITRNKTTDFKAFEKEIRELIKAVEKAGSESHAALRERVTTVETKMTVFWANVTIDMGKFLHSPHPENARMDYLLESLEAETITLEELKELITNLKLKLSDPHDKSMEQLAAAWMLRGLQQREDSEIFARALSEVGH